MHGQQPVCSLAEERELLAAGPPLPAHAGTGHLLVVLLVACQERQVLQHEGGDVSQLDSADLPPPPTLCTNLDAYQETQQPPLVSLLRQDGLESLPQVGDLHRSCSNCANSASWCSDIVA